MTVESTSSSVSYLYTGPGDYSYLFKAYLNSDIIVEHISTTGALTTLSESTDYTLLRATGDEGGTVTATYSATTGVIRISRILPLTQAVALENQGPLDMETLEKALDRNVMMMQQLDADLSGVTTASEWLGIWTTGTNYGIRNIIQGTDGNWYTCLADHTSAASFATDLAAGYWLLVIDVSAVTDLKTVQAENGTMVVTYGATTINLKVGSIATANIDNLAVTAAKLGNAAVTGAKIQAGAVTGDKITGFVNIVRQDIFGGNVTTSGQKITVSSFKCWDSTGSVYMETSGNSEWDVPATNNLEVYLFAVKDFTTGAISVKGYSSFFGPNSDYGTLISHSRFLHWNKNNGSGVLMPCRQIDDVLEWLTASKPVLTATTTASYASYSFTGVVPTSLAKRIRLVQGASEQVYYSYDGTTALPGFDFVNYAPVEIISIPSIYIKRGSVSVAVNVQGLTLRRQFD